MLHYLLEWVVVLIQILDQVLIWLNLTHATHIYLFTIRQSGRCSIRQPRTFKCSVSCIMCGCRRLIYV